MGNLCRDFGRQVAGREWSGGLTGLAANHIAENFSHSQELGPQEIQDVVSSTKTSSAMSASRQDSRVWEGETLRLLADRIRIFLESDSDLTI